jgi:hypothetical protein
MTFHGVDPLLRGLQMQGAEPGRHELDPHVAFVMTRRLAPPEPPEVAFTDATPYAAAFDRWRDEFDRLRGWPLGYFVFRDVFVIGPTGAVLAPDGRLFLGNCIGWSAEYANWSLCRRVARPGDRPDTLELTAGGVPRHVPAAVLGSGPGFDIFGHQLLDFGPRAVTVSADPVLAAMPMLRQALKNWAERLWWPVRNSDADIVMGETDLFHLGEVVVPTYDRMNSVPDAFALRRFANVQKANIRRAPVLADGGRSLFISRAHWPHNVRRTGTTDWEQVYRALDYTAVSPETMTLSDQIEMAAGAARLAGLDGSGLHLGIFADALEALDVIDTGRVNLLHFAVASLHRGCRVTIRPDS